MIGYYRFCPASLIFIPSAIGILSNCKPKSFTDLRFFAMKLVAGLGNPESRYTGTRHNIGFEAVEKIADFFQEGFSAGKGKYLAAKIRHEKEQVILIKPMTYMNLSGHAVVAAMNFYKIAASDILVICDDLNLPAGSIRLRSKGSAGGQNGLKHIIESLGSDEFARLRIGIKPQDQPLGSFSSFVLGKFSEEERSVMAGVLPVCRDAALDFAVNGINHAMNHFNKPAL
ncbi:peptidyl-tRNA hydrolase [Chlorobium ferrooxidans DSM 13031]|uniref:Peptidyl-tRNA hydrolase n=2 Tax=Chlorobium TaxID=1091 RepID=Q0YT90_9CHLB|nr:peptidyl-tRNA hydrolase [Chlorobium ferrooxidans DSM 13031]